MTEIQTHTLFTTSGEWIAVVRGKERAIFEAKWNAANRKRTIIVKRGWVGDCGAEAIAIATEAGEVF